MKDNINWELMLRYLSGECSSEDGAEPEAWLERDPENRKMLEVMKNIRDAPERRLPESDPDKAWAKVAKKAGITLPNQNEDTEKKTLPFPESRKRLFGKGITGSRWLRIAAVVLFAFSLPYFLARVLDINFRPSQTLAMKEIKVEYGNKAEHTLADGTRVVLDAGEVTSQI